ncbi:uroporphyrinogen-III C-methyltransferase [Thalassotalea fusca]
MTEEKNTDISSDASPVESTSDATPTSAKPSVASQSDTRKKTSRTSRSTAQPAPAKSGRLLAGFAIFISLVAVGGSGAHYWWQMQQQAQQTQRANQQIVSQVNSAMAQLTRQLNEQTTSVNQQLLASTELNAQLEESQIQLAQTIEQLTQKIARLESRKPGEWIIQEAEYLIRVAGRAMWLEQDTRAAIALLKDANQRLQELNDPQYLAVRKLIHQDIEALSLVPQLSTEDTVLSVMALAQQVPLLPISMAKIPESAEPEVSLELSEDIADWRENLAKTWEKVKEHFITVRRRTGTVEPLMSPQFQQNLKENLALKLQQVQFALAKQHSALYQASLRDINDWLHEYFDLESPQVNAFLARIAQLQQVTITVDLPSELKSLDAIRALSQANSTYDTSAPSDSPAAIELPQGKAEQDIPADAEPKGEIESEVNPPIDEQSLPNNEQQQSQEASSASDAQTTTDSDNNPDGAQA